ncbi:MAG: DUF3108 domain-containing protein [Pseudomonadota bacterium]
MSHRIGTRPLLALTALVLGAHAVLLRADPAVVQPADKLSMRPFVIRTVAVAVAEPQVAVQPPVEAAAHVSPKTQRIPARARGSQAEVMGVGSEAEPSPAPVEVLAAATPRASAAAASAQRAVAFLVPDSMRLRYKVDVRVRGIPLQGDGLLVWRHDADSYEATLEVSSPIYPTRIQRSTGRITAEGLAPARFSDKGRNEEAAHFERDKGKVSFSSNRPDAALMAGAQDRLSVMLQLAAMIGGDPARFPPSTSISIQTAGTRDAEPWIFTVEAAEQLELPGGKMNALKLIRNPRKEFDQKVELWLAPGMAYAPVRLRLTQPNGDWVDQQWSSTDKG